MNRSLLEYKVKWKPSGHRPGANQGLVAGIGDHLRSLVLLRDHPDPKRLDLRASLRDPFSQLWVRDFYLNTALKLIVLVDFSASMGFVGKVSRKSVMIDIASQLAMSAYKASDAFGLYAGNEKVLKELMLPPKVNKSAWLWVKQKFEALQPSGKTVDGLINIAGTLPRDTCLVFVISDFRWQPGKIETLFEKIGRHDVVPILLKDPYEDEHLPKNGIAILRDVETNQTRYVWMREKLRLSIQHIRNRHQHHLTNITRNYGAKPFVVSGEFEPAKLTKYFMERQG